MDPAYAKSVKYPVYNIGDRVWYVDNHDPSDQGTVEGVAQVGDIGYLRVRFDNGDPELDIYELGQVAPVTESPRDVLRRTNV